MACLHHFASPMALGWAFRAGRRGMVMDWWRESPRHREVDPDALMAEVDPGLRAWRSPRWLGPDRTWSSEGVRRRAGGWRANLSWGLAALFGTSIYTLGPCLIWMGAWEAGWVISFHKYYEQAFLGRAWFFAGMVWFALAMFWLPTAWGHFAASGGRWRAFVDFGTIARLSGLTPIRRAVYAVLFSGATAAVTGFRVAPTFLGNQAGFEELTEAEVAAYLNGYHLACAAALFPLLAWSRSGACRMYRRAATRWMERSPEEARRRLPAEVVALMDRLGLPAREAPRRGRARWLLEESAKAPARWAARVVTFAAWLAVAFLFAVSAFFNSQPILEWLNQPLLQLPSLHAFPLGR